MNRLDRSVSAFRTGPPSGHRLPVAFAAFAAFATAIHCSRPSIEPHAEPSVRHSAQLDPGRTTVKRAEWEGHRIPLQRQVSLKIPGIIHDAHGLLSSRTLVTALPPHVSANVVDGVTRALADPPFVIRRIAGVPVAFIRAGSMSTPPLLTSAGLGGPDFLDEASAINGQIPELHARGVHTIVVELGAAPFESAHADSSDPSSAEAEPDFFDMIGRLDDDIDVVTSENLRRFTAAIMPNAHGVPILVVRSAPEGTPCTDIDLVLDEHTNDVVSKSARLDTTFRGEGPVLTPDPRSAAR